MNGARSGSDRGETLVEVLVTVLILGLAGVAVMTGLATSVTASDIHRKDTTNGYYAKNYAEAVQTYIQGHQSAFNCSPDYSAATVGFIPAPGYTPTYAWGAVDETGVPTTCTSNTAQMVTVKVVSTGGRGTEQLSFVLRRPCSGDQAAAPTKCS